MFRGFSSRVASELRSFARSPPPGLTLTHVGEHSGLMHLRATLQGPPETPYSGGIFALDVLLPPDYPYSPPQLRFVTPVYHPNIDETGRICLDTLRMPPSALASSLITSSSAAAIAAASGSGAGTGFWTPMLTLEAVLVTIQVLLAHPNSDDGLVPGISSEFVTDRSLFEAKARESTRKHASACNDDKRPVVSEKAPSVKVENCHALPAIAPHTSDVKDSIASPAKRARPSARSRLDSASEAAVKGDKDTVQSSPEPTVCLPPPLARAPSAAGADAAAGTGAGAGTDAGAGTGAGAGAGAPTRRMSDSENGKDGTAFWSFLEPYTS